MLSVPSSEHPTFPPLLSEHPTFPPLLSNSTVGSTMSSPDFNTSAGLVNQTQMLDDHLEFKANFSQANQTLTVTYSGSLYSLAVAAIIIGVLAFLTALLNVDWVKLAQTLADLVSRLQRLRRDQRSAQDRPTISLPMTTFNQTMTTVTTSTLTAPTMCVPTVPEILAPPKPPRSFSNGAIMIPPPPSFTLPVVTSSSKLLSFFLFGRPLFFFLFFLQAL